VYEELGQYTPEKGGQNDTLWIIYPAHGDSSSECRGSDAKKKTRKRVEETIQDSPVEQTSVWETADEFYKNGISE
jgi:hypothetical protein